VHADVVRRGDWAKPGSDLFASLHCFAGCAQPGADANGSLGLSLGLYFNDDARFPPLELTLHNALRYGAALSEPPLEDERKYAPVDLYTFRPAICPSSVFATPLAFKDLNVDGRFREKLKKRVADGLVTVAAVWLPWEVCSARDIKKGPSKPKPKRAGGSSKPPTNIEVDEELDDIYDDDGEAEGDRVVVTYSENFALLPREALRAVQQNAEMLLVPSVSLQPTAPGQVNRAGRTQRRTANFSVQLALDGCKRSRK